MSAKAAFSPESVYQLKITLKDSNPPIWRRVLAPGRVSLFKLHQIIQAAMGWTDSHLHQFTIHGDSYSIPSEDDMEPVIDERRHALWKIVPLEKMSFVYEYDFGDSWAHQIEVEEIKPPNAEFKSPVCLEGTRACPPEDIGGIWGYSMFLDATGDPSHEEHESYQGWIDSKFDPESFDMDAINNALRNIK